MVEIKEGFVGLILAKDGRSLPAGEIFAPEWDEPEKMLNAEYFLGQGKGYSGPQLSVLPPKKYRINTKLFTITTVPITNVEVGTVAVIKSNVGETVGTDDRLVEIGQRGIWNKPLVEAKYRLHTEAYKVIPISIRQVKVSYTAEKEYGESGEYQPIRPIRVRTQDGVEFPVAVRITYKIESDNAPGIVASVGDDAMVLNKLVTPKVKSVFKNNAEKVKALDYVQNRSTQEKQSAAMLKEELSEYGVTILEVLIDDVGDEKSIGLARILKTQSDREIAVQEQATFEEQERTAEKQKALSKTQQEAEEEKRLATAMCNVQVAQQDKLKRIIDTEADAERIKVTAEAKAIAYKKVSEVIGPDNAALIEIMKLVESGRIRITPEVMVGGAGAGMSDALMGTVLKNMLDKNAASK